MCQFSFTSIFPLVFNKMVKSTEERFSRKRRRDRETDKEEWRKGQLEAGAGLGKSTSSAPELSVLQLYHARNLTR